MEKAISFLNSRGNRLAGIINYRDKRGSRPVVIACHGFDSGKNSATNRLLVDALSDLDIISVRFDFSGHYDSEGNIDDLTVSRGVDDLRACVDCLRSEHGFDLSRLGLFGTSYGGNVALWYVAHHDGVKAMAYKAPISDYAEVRERQLGPQGIEKWRNRGSIYLGENEAGVRSTYEFYTNAKEHNTYEMLESVTVPTVIVHGDEDDVVPIHQSERLKYAIGNNARLVVVEGAGHSFSGLGELNRAVELSARHFDDYLCAK